MIDALPLGEIDRQHAPLDAPFRHIKDGIEHRSHTQGARSSTAFGGGDQIFDPLPFLVSQVAWIDCFVHLPIVPTCKDFSDRLLEGNFSTSLLFGTYLAEVRPSLSARRAAYERNETSPCVA